MNYPTPNAPAPSGAPPLDDDGVYVLYTPPSQPFVRPLLGASKARAVTELRLARLTERHRVACVYVDAAGQHRLSEAVPVKAHWQREGEDGHVNGRTFTRALATAALPWHVKLRRDNEDDLGTLRIAEC